MASTQEFRAALAVMDNSRRPRGRKQASVTEPLTCYSCKKRITGSVTIIMRRIRRFPRIDLCLLCSLLEPWRAGLSAPSRRQCMLDGHAARGLCECGRLMRVIGCYHVRRSVFCSPRCQQVNANKRRRIRHGAIACTVCNEVFVPKRADAKTCSNRCRQAAFRAARRYRRE
jgi:predicted nucleic acid-binding Zn ribbon protein